MFKLLLILQLLIYNLVAQDVDFTESKYIDALDLSVEKKGKIEINKEYIKLAYPKEKKIFTFLKNKIISIQDEKEKILLYEENIQLEIFYILIKAIYFQNSSLLDDYFEIKEEKETTTLIPNDYISSVIDFIEYKKEKDYLNFLKIHFVNGDRIDIAQVK